VKTGTSRTNSNNAAETATNAWTIIVDLDPDLT
jgi:hypothetical protein